MKKFFVTLTALFFAVPAFAEEGATAVTHGAGGLVALGAGICLGAAALGGALGQGRAAASALDGIARNPAAAGKIQTPLILSLAFIESLVIYALIIAFQLVGKV